MSDQEQYFLLLLNKLMQGTIVDDEMELLQDLAKEDENKSQLLNYLMNDSLQIDTIEAEIVYEKSKPLSFHSAVLPSKEKPASTFISMRYAILATVALLVAVLLLYIYDYQSSKTLAKEWETYSTKAGERKFLSFNDGTEVWLNNDSELKVLNGFGTLHRRMKLQGEAYFSVSKNPKLPLVIHTKDTDVEVLGTKFNLQSYPESPATTTSLISGKVALKINRDDQVKSVIMKAGDQVRVAANRFKKMPQAKLQSPVHAMEDVTFSKVEVNNNKSNEMLWTENKLVFDNHSLTEIAQKLQRWYNKKIVIQSEHVANLSFSGTFQERECTQVLDILKKTSANFNYYIKDEIIYIKQ